MAEIKKYLDLVAAEHLVDKVKEEDAKVLQSAKDYVDSLAGNYDAAGTAVTEAGKVQTKLDEEVTHAKAREDEIAGLVATAQGEVDALELVVDTKANASDLTALANKVGEVPADKTVMDIITNIQENAYDDTEIRNLISGLDTNKADKTQVATDIADAVKAEEDARKEAVAGVQGEVDALEQTHATDKAALEASIALKADQTALDAVSGVANAAATKEALEAEIKRSTDEEARIEGLVTAEAAKAREEEGKLNTRLEEVEAFFKLAEGEQLDEALDTLKELQDFVNGEGAAADQMVLDIAANKKAIEDHIATNHDFAAADEALKEELNGEITKKADTTVVEELAGKVTTAEGDIDALEGRMDTVEADIDALQDKFGDGENSVSDMIADGVADAVAQAEAKDAEILAQAKAYADEEDAKIESRVDALETASATHALKTEVEAVAGRVTTAEGEIDTLQTEMDAVEAKAAANETAIGTINTELAKKAAQADLEAAVARVAQNETDIAALEEASATHALASDLTAAVERIAANETAIAANTSAINSFTAITVAEVDAMFA